MRNSFFIFTTLLALVLLWLYKNQLEFLAVLGTYALGIFWGLGYEWKHRPFPKTVAVNNLRKTFAVIAYASFNIGFAYNAYVNGGSDIIFFVIWFAVTSSLLYMKWKTMNQPSI